MLAGDGLRVTESPPMGTSSTRCGDSSVKTSHLWKALGGGGSRSGGLDTREQDQDYRAMDLLVEADTQAKMQESVFFAVADLLNVEVDLLLFDTTSTYFERDTEEDGEHAFREYGHSKDHHIDLPPIVIALAVTKAGIPVRCRCWHGNTSDQQALARGQGRYAGLGPTTCFRR